MKTRTIIEYLLATIIVLILGGLTGWYFFLRTQTQATVAQNTARGYGAAVPEGNADGSASSVPPNTYTGASSAPSSQTNSAPSRGFFSRLWSTVTGGSAGTWSGVASFDEVSAPFSSNDETPQASPQSAKPVPRPPQLWQVQGKPTAGQIFIGSEKNVRLRYVERASGYVFEADPETGAVVRLTNTLMPKIYEALLTENGHVYARSLDAAGSITTFVGTVSTSTAAASSTSSSAQTLLGSYLAKDIASIGVNPLSGALFYIVNGSDGASGVSTEWDGGKQKVFFSSVITSWRPTVLEDGRIILVQAAADSVPGFAYELKKDGSLSPVLGPTPGLTVRVRPASKPSVPKAILWSQSTRGVMSLFVRVDQNATEVLLPIRTIADKCVWTSGDALVSYCGVPQGTPGQNFLDDWYRGAVHSSDALWRIDASAGTAEMIYTPPSNTPIDFENIVVDSTGNYIAFTNAADKSLWLLRLTK